MDPEENAATGAAADDDSWLTGGDAGEADPNAAAGEGEGGAGGGEDDELEDYEDGDKRYRVPKVLVGRLMKDADYTTKTQELARDREELASARTKVTETAQGHMAMLQDVAKVVQLSEQLRRYEAITPEQWAAAHERDPDECSRARLEMQLLRETRDRAAGDLRTKEQQRLETQRGETAKAIEQRDAVLARDIKGWTKESTVKLANSPEVKTMGFKADEVLNVTDPRAIATIRWAALGMKAQAKAAASARASASEAAAPIARPQGAAAKPGLRDDLSADEWLRRRNAELSSKAKARGR